MKKLNFKLNTDAPGQHTAILVFGGVLLFLSVLEVIKSPSKSADEGPTVRLPYAESGQVLYGNPKLTWYEQYFCRGYQRSGVCSYRLLHPFRPVLEEHGVEIRDEPPAKDNVVLYRGSLPVNRAYKDHIRLDNFD